MVQNEESGLPIKRKIRSISWILIPAILGEHVGAAVGALYFVQEVGSLWGMDSAILRGLAYGATVGASIGSVGGAILWAFFPYKR